MAALQVVALADMGCHQPQLHHRATTLVDQPSGGQTRFTATDLGDDLGPQLDFVGNGFEEIRALATRAVAVRPECLLGGAAGRIDQCWRANRERVPAARRRGRMKLRGCCNANTADEVLAVRKNAESATMEPPVSCGLVFGLKCMQAHAQGDRGEITNRDQQLGDHCSP